MPIVVIGAGLAGLACAYQLQQANLEVIVLERDSQVGGRIQTDQYQGFLLDRGFQVLQTGYPLVQELFDLEQLKLHAFHPGAMIYQAGRFHELVDPIRMPTKIFSTLFSDVGTLRDKLQMWQLKRFVLNRSAAELFDLPEMSTKEYLLNYWKFSMGVYEQFFRPWFAGIFLEKELVSSNRLFLFYFRILAIGAAALPEQGLQALPLQLASKLKSGTVRLNVLVKEISDSIIHLEDGQVLPADKIVLAVDQQSAGKLMQSNLASQESRGTTCIYFSADHAPIAEPYLILNGDQTGLVNHLAVPSLVSPSYAPKGKHLISASIIGTTNDDQQKLARVVITQLSSWFGDVVHSWQHLKTYNISHALPATLPAQWQTDVSSHQISANIYTCGDYTTMGSVQGALYSGQRVAKAVMGEQVTKS